MRTSIYWFTPPDACSGQSEPGQSRELETQSSCVMQMAGTQLPEPQGLHYLETGIRSQSWDSNPGILIWEAGILTGVLTARPVPTPVPIYYPQGTSKLPFKYERQGLFLSKLVPSSARPGLQLVNGFFRG